MSYMNQEHLLNLADRCDAGADKLAYEAAHAAEVLADRGYPEADPQAWAARKTAAAEAARQYAQGLRDEAANMREADRPTEARIQEAEKVADAANLGGILIDGRPQAEATATADNVHVWNPADKEAWEAGTHPAQTKAAAVEGSGMFQHVAEPGQVPFWQLTDTTTAADAATISAGASNDAGCDDADGW
jgi:hypothetical protein